MALSGENLQTSEHTTDPGALQKGADFVKAFVLGFDVQVSSVAVFTSFSVSEAVRIFETSSFLRFSLQVRWSPSAMSHDGKFHSVTFANGDQRYGSGSGSGSGEERKKELVSRSRLCHRHPSPCMHAATVRSALKTKSKPKRRFRSFKELSADRDGIRACDIRRGALCRWPLLPTRRNSARQTLEPRAAIACI